MNHEKKSWCAIGDSFTYLNDHLDECGGRLQTGYLSRVLSKIPELSLTNIGINGSTTRDWLTVDIPEADLYSILLGTNDWALGIPLGDDEAFSARKEGTILGNLGILTDKIRTKNPKAQIFVLNPVERADFVYLFDKENNRHGSYAANEGQWLWEIAEGIFRNCRGEGIYPVNLHDLSGFTQENVVRFKRVPQENGYENLPYPLYTQVTSHPTEEEYPYPPEAIGYTYDGLHPSDEGSEIIAGVLADAIQKVL